jgi:hypothetical protein
VPAPAPPPPPTSIDQFVGAAQNKTYTLRHFQAARLVSNRRSIVAKLPAMVSSMIVVGRLHVAASLALCLEQLLTTLSLREAGMQLNNAECAEKLVDLERRLSAFLSWVLETGGVVGGGHANVDARDVAAVVLLARDVLAPQA